MNNQRVIIIIINVFQAEKLFPDSSQPVAYTQRSMKRPSVTRWSKGCARVRADKTLQVRQTARSGVTARWTFPPLPFDCCIGDRSAPRVKRIDAAAPSTLIIISVRYHPIVS